VEVVEVKPSSRPMSPREVPGHAHKQGEFRIECACARVDVCTFSSIKLAHLENATSFTIIPASLGV
jgi:hypothetical protein